MYKPFEYFYKQLSKTPSTVILCASLVACSFTCIAETPEDAESIHEEVTQTIPYVTIRNKTGNKDTGDYYGGGRSTAKAGICELSNTPLTLLEPLAEKASFYIPDDIITLEAVRESTPKIIWNKLKKSSSGSSATLYTHGFNVDFERGCKRASVFQKAIGLEGRFIFFSWPSDGAILNYTHDEADVYWSVKPLQQTLLDMSKYFGKGNSNVVAHSLGTRGVLLALVMLAEAEQSKTPLFNQVVFIASDTDAEIFKQYLPLIKPLAKNITVYVSANDAPLALSRQVHGYPRLGESGEHLDGLTGVDIIDVSDIPVRYPSGHLYHLYHEAVANDLKQLINENKQASQRDNLKQTATNYWRLQHEAAE